jgi:hypothetical protein
MNKISDIPSRHRANCARRVHTKSPAAPDSREELAEEVRQLKAAVALYRHVAERLLEERRN